MPITRIDDKSIDSNEMLNFNQISTSGKEYLKHLI